MSLYPPPSHRRQASSASTVSTSSSTYSFPSSRSTTVSSTTSSSSRFSNMEGRGTSLKHKHSMSLSAAPPVVSSYTTNMNSGPTTPPRPLSGSGYSPLGSRAVRGYSIPSPSNSPSSYAAGSTSPVSSYARPQPTPTPYNSLHRHTASTGTTSLKSSDINSLRNSSVSHFRTLSRLTNEGSREDFAMDSGQDVAGMHGRKRLQRVNTDNLTSWERMNWMDKRRQYIQAYEYLCHIGEAKEWLEDCIGEPIPPIVELEEALRDGVTLAKLVRVFTPELVPRIFEAKKLQFRHSDNIDRFFRFLKRVELPEIFIFELTDLYNKKNIPKVIYCIHALSYLLIRLGMTSNSIGNLVGKLEFTEKEIQDTQKSLDISGVSLPSFRGVNKHFGHEEEPEPEPPESEEDRIERELGELEPDILELQNICRGALVRMRLGLRMEILWDNEDAIIQLQAMIRGMFSRMTFGYRADMARWATEIQAATKGYAVRQAMLRKQRHFTAHERLIVRLQARYRAKKVREEYIQQKMRLEMAEMGVIMLQAVSKGLLLRKQFQSRTNEVYEKEEQVISFQAKVRGALLRTRVAAKVKDVSQSEDRIVEAQAAIRGVLVRWKMGEIKRMLLAVEENVTMLQGAARGGLIRRKVSKDEQALEEMGSDLTILGAVARGVLVRKAMLKDRSTLKDAEPTIISLQAAAKGLLVRKAMLRDMSALKDAEPAVISLQAAAKGALVRKAMIKDITNLKDAETETPTTTLQAAAKGFLVRMAIAKDMASLKDAEQTITALQAAAKGFLIRRSIKKDQEILQAESNVLVYLQASIRGYLLRKSLDADTKALEAEIGAWTDLQAASRGTLVRWEYRRKLLGLAQAEDDIIDLQACARGFLSRKLYDDTLDQLDAAIESIVDLQALSRGVLQRWTYLDTLDALDHEVNDIITLQSSARGFLYRQRQQRFLNELAYEVDDVIATQAAIRGVLMRKWAYDIVMAVQDEEEAIIDLQALSRGCLERKRFFGKLKHFKENMEKVIKIQSFVRGKQQGEAYKSLMGGKNPPVGTVKNFVHLLNDSDFDFDEEIEFESLRKSVVQHVRANELAEAYVDQLDIKIALLVKNKITLDEVIRHQKRFTGHVGNLLSNTEIASSDPFDLKALNNNSRKRLERYQQMFFALQTQPQYLTRMFQRIREQNTADQELKRVENLVMGIFGYAQKRREEYYLLKLIAKSIKEEVENCNRPEEFLRVNFFWLKLAMNYIRSPKDRKFLRDVLGPLIKLEFIENDDLDLESDPLQIYLSSINNEELRTGMRSKRNPNVGREVAIHDQETRETFVAHLSDLRNLSDDFISAMEDNLNRMPYGIRYIAQQAVSALLERFPHEGEDVILQIVEHFVYQKYWGPAVVGPESFGVVEKTLTPMQKRNLAEVGKLLNQISSGRLFAQDNIYLQPLNHHITEAVTRMKDIFRAIINVPDAKTRFDIDEFEDLTSKKKPTLYIKMTDIFAIHRLVAQDIENIAPNREDQLRVIISELGSVQTSEAELKNVGNTEIGLHLDPHFQKIEDPDSEVNALFVETKRCILYIIRVQIGTNLMEILVKPIIGEDEDKWEQLLIEEKAQVGKKKSAYADATHTLSDVSTMTYAELKRTALECIIRLEKTGKITRKNHYQDLLNAIATDIRTKHRRRIERTRELDGVKMTLAHLNEKAQYLESQLQSYNDYIEQAMVTLQTKKGKKKAILPFTRQYFHMRELQRSGRVPKFGSYKYTARGLADKGVLVTLDGYPEKRWDKVNFTISSDEVGIFFVEASNGSMMIPGASAQVLLDNLLQMQFHNSQFMNLCDGMIKFNVNLFLHLIFRKFYRDE